MSATAHEARLHRAEFGRRPGEWGWRTFWMILHVMGAVIAFGPMYAQPLIRRLGRRNPQHAVLAAEITDAIA